MSNLAQTVSLLGVLSDSSRLRLLALTEGEELSVAELTRISELPQSRVSTHLGRLHRAGLLRRRRVGTSTLYALNEAAMPSVARELWRSVREKIDDATLANDLARRAEVMRNRDRGQTWPDTVAGQMERHYSPGRTWEATARAFVGLVQLGDALDVGSGDGALARLLAAQCQSLTCLDSSPVLLEAARERLCTTPNVQFALGDMHDLPFGENRFDQVLMFHVLTYATDPTRAIAEAERVLRPSGTLALATLHRHTHMDIASTYSHTNAGFSPLEIGEMLDSSGLETSFCAVTSRERKAPHFEVVTAVARKP